MAADFAKQKCHAKDKYQRKPVGDEMSEEKTVQIQRIEYHEELMQKAEEIMGEGTKTAARFARLTEALDKLSSYYSSPEWKQDFADDEAGLLPEDLKRGVLSEDGIYNLLDKGKEWTQEVIDELLAKKYWVIDILPRQVAKYQDGQYFEIEKYYLESPRIESIRQKYANILIKLNCYYDICCCLLKGEEEEGGWHTNPSPKVLEGAIKDERFETCTLNIVIPVDNTLIVLNGDDHYMTIYNPESEMRKLLDELAASEGVFLWKPEEE